MAMVTNIMMDENAIDITMKALVDKMGNLNSVKLISEGGLRIVRKSL